MRTYTRMSALAVMYCVLMLCTEQSDTTKSLAFIALVVIAVFWASMWYHRYGGEAQVDGWYSHTSRVYRAKTGADDAAFLRVRDDVVYLYDVLKSTPGFGRDEHALSSREVSPGTQLVTMETGNKLVCTLISRAEWLEDSVASVWQELVRVELYDIGTEVVTLYDLRHVDKSEGSELLYPTVDTRVARLSSRSRDKLVKQQVLEYLEMMYGVLQQVESQINPNTT